MKSYLCNVMSRRVLVLALLVVAITAPQALAQSGQPLTVNFVDTAIADVIRSIVIQIEGAGLSMTDDVTGKISLYVTDRRPEEVLDLVCKTNGLRWWKEGNVYFVTARAADAAPAATTPAPIRPGNKSVAIYLKHAVPQDIAYLFGGAREPLTPGYAEAMSQGSVQARPIATQQPFLGASGRTARSPFEELKQYTFPGTTVLPSVIPGATTPAPVMPGQPTTTAEVTGPLSELLPEGLSRPVAIPMLNAVIVQGPEDAIDQFRKLVELLDIKVKQVMIESQFIEIRLNDAARFGIDWSAVAPNLDVTVSGFAPAASSTGFIQIGYARGSLQAILGAMLSSTRAKVVAAPKVATMNGLPASLLVTTDYPYFTQTSVVQPGLTGGQVIAGSQLNVITLTSGLVVTPKINEDNTITATVTPQITDIAGTIPGPGGSTIPIQSSRSVQTTLRVKDGETIVMGGFVRTSQTRNRARIPLLSDIPLIGKLFQAHNNTVDDSELLIFLTARIVPDSTPGALTTGEPMP